MAHEIGDGGEALLQDFLSFLADYVPTIPDELTDYYAKAAGFQCPDAGVRRLVSVATQKFVAEIADGALQYCKLRQTVGGAAGAKERRLREKRLVLTTEDLTSALKENGVDLKRAEYFADSVATGIVPVSAPAAVPPVSAPAED